MNKDMISNTEDAETKIILLLLTVAIKTRTEKLINYHFFTMKTENIFNVLNIRQTNKYIYRSQF